MIQLGNCPANPTLASRRHLARISLRPGGDLPCRARHAFPPSLLSPAVHAGVRGKPCCLPRALRPYVLPMPSERVLRLRRSPAPSSCSSPTAWRCAWPATPIPLNWSDSSLFSAGTGAEQPCLRPAQPSAPIFALTRSICGCLSTGWPRLRATA